MPGIAPLQPSDPPVIGAYRLLGRLGAGGQGVVYQAHSEQYGMIAIKALPAGWLADPAARARLAKEVAAARRVAPFCTARVLEAQLDGDRPFVVSEFIPGFSLEEQVRSHGPLTGTALDRLAVGTLTALVAIHEANLVHRDLKPSNVMLGPDGPRVVDFGIARDLTGQGTRTDAVVGSPAYVSPEQVNGERVGPAADLFSWAATMVFAATGRSPFDAGTVIATLHRVTMEQADLTGVPEPLAGVLRGCLVRDPSRRPTAQQALMVLLGQPMPAGDVEDPAELLAHAATVAAPPTSGMPALTPTMVPAPMSTTMAQPVPPPSSGSTGSIGSIGSTGSTGRAGRRADGRRSGPSIWSIVLAAVGVLGLVGGMLLYGLARQQPGPLTMGSGPTVPGDFAGTWTGGLSRGSQHWATQLKLAQGATVGESTVGACQYVLTVEKLSDDEKTLTLLSVPTVTPDGNCGNPSETSLKLPDQAPSDVSQVSLDVQVTDVTTSSSEAAVGTVVRTA